MIDLVEGTPEQQDNLKAPIAGKEVFGSELVHMESRLQAVRDQRDDLLNIYDGYCDSCLLVPFERS